MAPSGTSPISARIAGARVLADAASPRRVDHHGSGELLARWTTARRQTDDRPDHRAFQASPATPVRGDYAGAGASDRTCATRCRGLPTSLRYRLSWPLW